MREVVRSYCITVLLGRPRERLFFPLRQLLSNPTVWFTEKRPLFLRPLGGVWQRLPDDKRHLLWELGNIAQKHEGRVLTLIALTPEMQSFVTQNQNTLSMYYKIRMAYEA